MTNKKLFLFITAALTLIFISSCSQKGVNSHVVPSGDGTTWMKPKDILPFSIPYSNLEYSKIIYKFGFGARNNQNQAQPLWKLIRAEQTDLFILVGDGIESLSSAKTPMSHHYIKLNTNEEYKQLREETPFLTIWNEHDYGQSNGDQNNPIKSNSRFTFLNYWGYLRPSLPLKQEGLYHSRLVGSAKNKTQFILLDVRWNKTKNSLLSESQWAWLESELKKPSDIKFIISPIQVIADDHKDEKWGHYPKEKERLFNLIKKLNLRNIVFISADRDHAAIAKLDLNAGKSNPFMIYDITSGLLNGSSSLKAPEKDSSYISSSYIEANYGLANIDWVKRTIQFDIKNKDNKVVLSQTVPFLR